MTWPWWSPRPTGPAGATASRSSSWSEAPPASRGAARSISWACAAWRPASSSSTSAGCAAGGAPGAAGRRLPARDGLARQRPDRDRRPGARHRPGRDGGRARVREGAGRLWAADRRVPGDSVHAGRHVGGDRGRAPPPPQGRLPQGPGAVARPGGGRGEAGRVRGRPARRDRRSPDPRRRRLLDGVPARAPLPRRAGVPDLGRDEPDPAARDQPPTPQRAARIDPQRGESSEHCDRTAQSARPVRPRGHRHRGHPGHRRGHRAASRRGGCPASWP